VGESVRSYGGKTARERAEDRRLRLVEATIAVLGEQGEAHTTMTAICAHAGLTERYFYESFAHRDEALLAALDLVSEEIAADARRVVERAPGPPAERVHAVMSSFVAWVGEQPERGKVAVVHSSATPGLRTRRHELIGAFAELAASESEELYGADAWPPDQARLHGIVYIAGLAELVAAWLTGEVDLTPDELTRTAGDLFVSMSRRGQT